MFQLVFISGAVLAVLLRGYGFGQTEEQSSPKGSQADRPVSLTVTVTDKKGRLIKGLPRTSFSVHDDKLAREISVFSDKVHPMSIGIAVDISPSIVGSDPKRLVAVKDALIRFARSSSLDNEYFIVTFSESPTLLTDWTRDVGTVIDGLGTIEPKKPRAGTAFFDACYFAISKMNHGSHPKRIILLVTDGQDNRSRHTLSEINRLLQGSETIVYSIGSVDYRDSIGRYGEQVLGEISRYSGGVAVFPNGESEIASVFAYIALELQHQYTIEFVPANNSGNGKLRRIKVDVTEGGAEKVFHVRSRYGYYDAPH